MQLRKIVLKKAIKLLNYKRLIAFLYNYFLYYTQNRSIMPTYKITSSLKALNTKDLRMYSKIPM